MLRVAFLSFILLAPPARGEVGINLYGASYHFERDRARELGLTNEVNPGLGLRWRKPHSDNLDLFADAGFYRDSAANRAKLLGAGALWHATEGLRLGGALVLLHSKTYNAGAAFITPAPIAAYEWRRVSFNVVYFPQFRELNRTNQLGFWLTLWLTE